MVVAEDRLHKVEKYMRGEEQKVTKNLFQGTFLAKRRTGGIGRFVLFSKGSTEQPLWKTVWKNFFLKKLKKNI